MSHGIRLNTKSIAALPPRAKRYIVWDAANAGFGVRVTTRGTKSFVYAYRFDGHSRLLTLGNTPPRTLEQARAAFAEAKATVDLAAHQRRHEGIAPAVELDPARTKSKRHQVRNMSPTVDDLWTSYKRKRGAQLRPKTLAEYDRMMRVHVSPELGTAKVLDVKPRDIKRILDDAHLRGPVLANRLHGFLAGLFNLARHDLIIETSPVRAVKQPATEAPRQRALTEAEMRGLFTALPQTTLPPPVRLLLQLVLATGVRPGEACKMRWSDIDDEARLWTVPAEFVKTKKAHMVPLAPFALALIEECRRAKCNDVWAFPAPRGKAILTGALSQSLRDPKIAARFREQGVAPFTPHDLRRSCRTGLARLGILRHVAEATVGHEHRRGIEQVYDQYGLLPERRAALEAWGAHLTALCAGPNVMPLKSAA